LLLLLLMRGRGGRNSERQRLRPHFDAFEERLEVAVGQLTLGGANRTAEQGSERQQTRLAIGE
jgi:hypothetical protein